MDAVRSAGKTSRIQTQTGPDRNEAGRHRGNAGAVKPGEAVVFVGTDGTANLPSERPAVKRRIAQAASYSRIPDTVNARLTLTAPKPRRYSHGGRLCATG